MTVENEIVMVGGISQSTGEVFSAIKVVQSFVTKYSLPIFFHPKDFSHSDTFRFSMPASMDGLIILTFLVLQCMTPSSCQSPKRSSKVASWGLLKCNDTVL